MRVTAEIRRKKFLCFQLLPVPRMFVGFLRNIGAVLFCLLSRSC